MQRNDGISVTGGHVNFGAAAAGPNATATSSVVNNVSAAPDGRLDEIKARLEALVSALGREGQGLAHPEHVAAPAKKLAMELDDPAPNPHRVQSLLGDMEEGAKGIASVAGIVQTLKPLVMGLLGSG